VPGPRDRRFVLYASQAMPRPRHCAALTGVRGSTQCLAASATGTAASTTARRNTTCEAHCILWAGGWYTVTPMKLSQQAARGVWLCSCNAATQRLHACTAAALQWESSLDAASSMHLPLAAAIVVPATAADLLPAIASCHWAGTCIAGSILHKPCRTTQHLCWHRGSPLAHTHNTP
jgi:hypothetical protein